MNKEESQTNPLIGAARAKPSEVVQKQLAELRDHWAQNNDLPVAAPLVSRGTNKPREENFSGPDWISGWDAFEILRLQTEPYKWAPPIARICQIIAEQVNSETDGVNYAINRLPPNHELLKDFSVGSNHWFRALYSLLSSRNAMEIEGWERLVGDLYDWIGPYDSLRIRAADLFKHAIALDWPWLRYSLPEAKQEPVWSFPKAMAWIGTRDYLALARIGNFRRPEGEDEAVATEGVCRYNTEALGWLHTVMAYSRCECGSLNEFGWESYKHCTCISVAWEDLVHFNKGLTKETPELVFNLQEGWLSMTWPEGADDLRFLRRDILERWPPRPIEEVGSLDNATSSAKAESECRDWLLASFAADPDQKRSKRSFQEEAMRRFSGRLSLRGFRRVWDGVANQEGRSKPGRKS